MNAAAKYQEPDKGNYVDRVVGGASPADEMVELRQGDHVILVIKPIPEIMSQHKQIMQKQFHDRKRAEGET